MFENLHLHAKVLHAEMSEVYWIMLPAIVVLLIVFEVLKGPGDAPNVADILKRAVISILLLLSFGTVVNTVAMLSDGITEKISGSENVWDAVKNLGPNSQGESDSLFDIREHIIYFFAIGAYLIAYIGFFASVALVNFVWAVLYVCAPLLLLCYVSRVTAPIVGNLYRGLISVATWKILWSLLGSLLLKLAMDPKVVGIEDYFLSMVMNLLIGLSMLLIPFFTKSLIGDGLQAASSALAAAPGLMASKAITLASKKWARQVAKQGAGHAGFVTKPLINPISGRAKVMAHRLRPRNNKFKKEYSEFGLPEEAKKIIKSERSKKFAKNNHRKR